MEQDRGPEVNSCTFGQQRRQEYKVEIKIVYSISGAEKPGHVHTCRRKKLEYTEHTTQHHMNK